MSDSPLPFWLQALGTVAVLALVVGIVAWQMRGDRKEFRLLRVFGVAFAALLGSLPFAAAFWWFAPHDADRHSPWLLAAVFVPIFLLEAWGISFTLRRWRRRHHEHTTA
jgi:hypothetical protein